MSIMDSLPRAFVLSGPRGIGKAIFMAGTLAQAMSLGRALTSVYHGNIPFRMDLMSIIHATGFDWDEHNSDKNRNSTRSNRGNARKYSSISPFS